MKLYRFLKQKSKLFIKNILNINKMGNFKCKRCKTRGKTWQGDDPVCGFNSDGSFNKENWNCATLGELRPDRFNDDIFYNEDDNLSVTIISDKCEKSYGFLILTWYKNRGRTGGAMIMCDNQKNVLTLEQAEEIISTNL